MNCKQFHDHLLDLAAGTEVPEAQAHVETCPDCAAQLASVRQTLSLMEEWQAPTDVSPYFMTRLRARMREEERQQTQSAGWLGWFRKPGLAISMMLLMVVSIGLFQGGWHNDRPQPANQTVQLKPGTPVADLQYLDRNHELLADFDLLDDVQPNQNSHN